MSQTEAEGSRWRVVVDVLAFVGPVTLLSGILYYFGYVSARTFYAYFGISLSILEFSPANYLVRSADTFFRPVATMLVVRGERNAELTELTLVLQPQAVVYSDRDLHLPGPGVGRTLLDGGENSYRFRYNGLRPLLHANDRWFLLPVHWRHDNGSTVIVLHDEPGRVRVDLAP